MKLPRRRFLHLAACIATLPPASRIARAQAYPSRPAHIIVGFPAGSATDIVARLIAQSLSERLGQQVIVDDRPGAGSNIGAEVVIRAAPDGYTLLMITAANAINATLYASLSFDFIRDITPVAIIGTAPAVVVVNPSVPAKTVPEFIAYAKANPGKINYASSGYGSVSNVFGEFFKMMTGVNLVHVPYRSPPQALTDLIGGQVQVMFSFIPSSIEYIRTGKLRALAVTTATRSDALPDIPAIGEFVPGYEASGWYGLGAPKRTSTEIIEKLNKEINAVVADPSATRHWRGFVTRARLVGLGVEPMSMTPAEFGKFTTDETEKWAKVIRAANIKPD